MVTIGFLAALGAALAWGSYIVPFKISKSEKLLQSQFLMGMGVFISGLITSYVLNFSLNINIYGVVSGFFWVLGNILVLHAVLNLGLSKAAPIVSSIIILCSFLWGVFVFNELPSGILTGGAGIGLIILGVITVSNTSSSSSINIKKGLISAVLSGLLFGSQLVPLKLGQVAPYNFFFSVCVGIFILSTLIFLLSKSKFEKEAINASLQSGLIWNVGNLLSIISISIIGLAKGGPITQLANLVAVLWGLFYFKEVSSVKMRLQILIGAAILLTGIIILGFA